jgi:hypothetical protein
MSTRALQVILFPEDGHPPRLVPLVFNLMEKEGGNGTPGVFPSTIASSELDRVLSGGRAAALLLDREYHMIAPRLAGIDSDQVYCADFFNNAYLPPEC